MIELVRDAATLVLAWCVGLTLTYGVVESSLMMGPRILFAAAGPPGWWGETLVYCPICAGLWCHAFAFGTVAHVTYLGTGAVVGTALALALRGVGVELVRPPFSRELPAIEAMRARHAAREEVGDGVVQQRQHDDEE